MLWVRKRQRCTISHLWKISHVCNIARTSRDLYIFNMLSKEATLPRLQEVDIHMQGRPDHCCCASVLLPHELFASLHTNANGWRHSTDEGLVQEFWSNFSRDHCMSGHPLLHRQDFQTRCVPLSLHGDEVPITGVGKIWCRSALTLSWTSFIATAAGASLEDNSMYIYGIF